MDFTELSKYFVFVVVLACLIIGYGLKHATVFKKIPNDDIPEILAVVGAILNVIVSGPSVNSVVFGAFSGMASTGFHQSFKAFVEGRKNTDDPDEEEN